MVTPEMSYKGITLAALVVAHLTHTVYQAQLAPLVVVHRERQHQPHLRLSTLTSLFVVKTNEGLCHH